MSVHASLVSFLGKHEFGCLVEYLSLFVMPLGQIMIMAVVQQWSYFHLNSIQIQPASEQHQWLSYFQSRCLTNGPWQFYDDTHHYNIHQAKVKGTQITYFQYLPIYLTFTVIIKIFIYMFVTFSRNSMVTKFEAVFTFIKGDQMVLSKTRLSRAVVCAERLLQDNRSSIWNLATLELCSSLMVIFQAFTCNYLCMLLLRAQNYGMMWGYQMWWSKENDPDVRDLFPTEVFCETQTMALTGYAQQMMRLASLPSMHNFRIMYCVTWGWNYFLIAANIAFVARWVYRFPYRRYSQIRDRPYIEMEHLWVVFKIGERVGSTFATAVEDQLVELYDKTLFPKKAPMPSDNVSNKTDTTELVSNRRDGHKVSLR